jgi:hypothetical protein
VVLVLYCASVSANPSGGARKGLEAADRAVTRLRARLPAFDAAFLLWSFCGAAKPYFETALVLLWAFCGECCSSREGFCLTQWGAPVQLIGHRPLGFSANPSPVDWIVWVRTAGVKDSGF